MAFSTITFLYLVLSVCTCRSSNDLATLEADLQTIVDESASAYNCSFSVAVKGATFGESLSIASEGITNESKFAWGSITKMWTGASIMQHVASGKLRLDEPFAPYVNAQFAVMKKNGFPGMNFSTVRDLWGPEVEHLTIRNLIHMQSGIPDFDTADPSPGQESDPFRATVYAHASHDFWESTLLSVPWVATGKLEGKPGQGMQYSSTNFGLLGLILSNLAGVEDYRRFNQSLFLKNDRRLEGIQKDIRWAQRGSPRDLGVVDGFDRTRYNGQDPTSGGVNLVDVHGVFAGWSASDFVGPASAVAELGYALYGKASALVPQPFRDMMIPKPLNYSFYGLATMNVGMMGITGETGDLRTAYGHMGATYGYQSVYGYNPKLDLGIAIATNMETEAQSHPSDAYCRVYNRVKNYVLKQPIQTCKFIKKSWSGDCVCDSGKSVIVI